MFGKILSISDDLMWRYYELLSSKKIDEIGELKKDVENGTIHPKAAKEALAVEIVSRYYDENQALSAKEEFDKIHAKHDLPSDLKTFTCKGPIWVAKALVDAGLEPSTSQARRDISQGAVKCDQEKVTDEQWQISEGEYVLQVGKRKFIQLKVTS
jgi:tyrosyl-tRNA synthetase